MVLYPRPRLDAGLHRLAPVLCIAIDGYRTEVLGNQHGVVGIKADLLWRLTTTPCTDHTGGGTGHP